MMNLEFSLVLISGTNNNTSLYHQQFKKLLENYNSMLNNRSKKYNSQTPTRSHPNITNNQQFPAFIKQKDSFFSRLNKICNKENNDPNTNEVKTSFQEMALYQQKIKHSSSKNIITDRSIPTKNINIASNKFNSTVKNVCEFNSSSKFNKQLEQKQKALSNDRNPAQKNEPHVNNFLDQYLSQKQEIQKSKKTKVTIKNIKKQIRQTHQIKQNLFNSTQQITKAFPKQFLSSLQNQILNNQSYQMDNFCKNVQQKIQKRTIIGKVQTCFNHPQKKASYKLLDCKNKQKAFCQKCSVILVTKGFKVKQLDQGNHIYNVKSNQIQQKRIKILQVFLFDIDKLQPIYTQTKKQLLEYKNLIDQNYKLEEKKLQTYYKEIFKIIQTSYQKNLFNLKILYNSILQELDQNQNSLQDNYHNIQVIKQDILPNISSIIKEKQVNETTFQRIVEDYRESLKCFNFKMIGINKSRYCYYEYQKLDYGHLIEQIQQLIGMNVIQQNIKPVQQLESITGAVKDKTTELFRISFGKETSPQLDIP